MGAIDTTGNAPFTQCGTYFVDGQNNRGRRSNVTEHHQPGLGCARARMADTIWSGVSKGIGKVTYFSTAQPAPRNVPNAFDSAVFVIGQQHFIAGSSGKPARNFIHTNCSIFAEGQLFGAAA